MSVSSRILGFVKSQFPGFTGDFKRPWLVPAKECDEGLGFVAL